MDWQMWPEEDEGILGQAVIDAWEMVAERQEQDGYVVHKLEAIVVCKVRIIKRCYIG